MTSCLASAGAALALLFATETGVAQSGALVQLAWQAPVNCPQEAQVRQKLRELLGASAGDAAPSRLRAEGRIEPIGERFRLTLNIHYDLVNGSRVVNATSCEDLGGVAALTLALLFRTEHSSGAPLTERDLRGASTAALAENRAGDVAGRASDSVNRDNDAEARASDSANRASDTDHESTTSSAAPEKLAASDQGRSSESNGSKPASLRFAFRVPELRVDAGVLPAASYGIGLAGGLRYDAWRFLVSGTFWLAQNYESRLFVGYGAHFARVSGELSVCRGWRFTGLELAPCVLLSLDDVSARGTGVGISSTDPWTAWVSVGPGFQGLWSLSRSVALVLGVNARIATSKPRFVSESVGEMHRVGPVALGAMLGCEWGL
ncbi:MAG TPA: hypothetical protein VJV79_13640 [Polyangiaceae bacterium]|nr:hypothetical protein [Polyangiaceae bacterium]